MTEQASTGKRLIILVCGFIIGGLVGLNLAGSEAWQSTQLSAYPTVMSMPGEHSHEQYDISTEAAPILDIELIEEEKVGKFTLRIETEDFTFTPEALGAEAAVGTGHAHVFVDDVKLGRAYGAWYDLPKLKPGEHTIRVTLNTNDHRVYAVEGVPVATSTTVEVISE